MSTNSKTTNPTRRLRKVEGLQSDRSLLTANSSSVTSGIHGLDQILGGGYLQDRATVIRGGSGTGKTVFALMFATAGASKESAIYASFDESIANLKAYIEEFPDREKVRFLDFTPHYDSVSSGVEHVELGGMLVRLRHAVQQSGARKLVLDALDALFERYINTAQVRHDLSQIFMWCRENGVTLLATAGVDRNYSVARDILDYASDSTIYLDQELSDGIMTRTLRVLKMRGRSHGTNEYPFLIDEYGISVMPVTNSRLDHKVLRTRLSLGVEGLDKMLGGRGIFVGSMSLISGRSGTGKTLLAAAAAEAFCKAGKKVLYVSFEQPVAQIVRDSQGIGSSLQPLLDSGNLEMDSIRAVELGIEQHIILLLRKVERSGAKVLIVDPLTSLADMGNQNTFRNMTIRLSHALREAGITVVFTELWSDSQGNKSNIYISSLVDTWIKLFYEQESRKLQRSIMVAKSRGSATSNEIRNFEISKTGLQVF